MNSTQRDAPDSRNRVGIVAIVVLLCIVPLHAGAATNAAVDDTEEAFLVEVDANGDAVVTVRMTYDLEDEDAHEAFESLRDDATAQQEASDRFRERLRSVADRSASRVDRSMAVSDVAITLDTSSDGTIGVVTLEATWTGLAAVNGDRLVVTEPFASGFSPDRTFVITGPDGYALVEVSPSPHERTANTGTWSEGSDLDGFEATFEAGGDAGGNGGSDSIPGFGVVVGVLALLFAVGLRVRRG